MIRIGCGTGRCGTTSLSKLINNLPGYMCTHERAPQLTLKFDLDNKEKYLIQTYKFKGFEDEEGINFRKRPDTETMDVAWYHLTYLDKYINKFGVNVRVIVLKRDKEETIKSLNKTIEGDKYFSFRKRVIDYFTHLSTTTNPIDLFRGYYDSYYDEIAKLQIKFPNHIKIFNTEEINTNQDGIFDWLEIPISDRRYLDNCVHNKS